MSDVSDQQKLDLALAVSNRAQAEDALRLLHAMAEPDRRRVLRPHWEDPDGITDQRDLNIRRGFDMALNQLAALEFAVSTGYLPLKAAAAKVDRQTRELLTSRAVARFIDDYDYFQIRFLANRLGPIDFKLPRLPELPILDATPEHDACTVSFLKQTIDLQEDDEVQLLFAFLDNYNFMGMEKGDQQDRFRVWLADNDTEKDKEILAYFSRLKLAMARWLLARFELYKDELEAVQARLAVFDIYWLLKLFNAEISTSGGVSYCGSSWLELLSDSPHFEGNRFKLLDARRNLRRALGLACDWIRGEAIEEQPKRVTAQTREAHAPVSWIDAFKAELHEIQEHRRERHLAPAAPNEGGAVAPYNVRHGLIGLAFSGGGIRSSTFNLGVLEALKENDFLRFVDYLSTVSGGGYIGAWLVANAKRRGYWVRREADWLQSIKHLRDFSNYLSPHLGFMSADTWTMWTTFLRNTILVQMQVFLGIAACMLIPYLLRSPFESLLGGAGNTSMTYFDDPGPPAAILLGLCAALICAGLIYRRKPIRSRPEKASKLQQQSILLGVCILIPASLYVTATFWRSAGELLREGANTYGLILNKVLTAPYEPYLFGAVYAALAILAFTSVRKDLLGITAALLAPIGATAALVLESCALILLLQGWLRYAPMDRSGAEAAFVFGPALVIAVLSLSVYVLTGLLGKASDGQKREWWSRYGALLSMAIAGWLILSVAAVYGPFWIEKLGAVKWLPIFGWVATSLGSVLAGKSGETSGEGKSKTRQLPLELLAVAGPFVAIAGVILGISWAVHAVLLAVNPSLPGTYWEGLSHIDPTSVWYALAIVLVTGFALTWRVDINIFGLSEFYRSRLVRCYLGASRSKRRPHPFTGFDEDDDLPLASLRTCTPAAYATAENTELERAPFAGPYPIVNCTLNLGGSSDLAVKTRRSDCFTMTPLHCGFNHKDPLNRRFGAGGYCPTEHYCGKQDSPTLGLAVAVSGAAANPNMGYHTSPLTSFLMTIFNARLGCWFANPSLKKPITRISPHFSLPSLVRELFGTADDGSSFVDVSDGGHFENLGIYELVRRRCRLIVASDAECDFNMSFGSLGNVIRLCEVDFGAKIRIDVSSIRKDEATGRSHSHCAVGKIEYGNGDLGTLIYIKSSLLENENTAVLQYLSGHLTFPHESTADQFFTEDQFESYRKLGYDCTKRTFRDTALQNGQDEELESFAQELSDIWTPVKNSAASFISSTNSLSRLWETLGKDPDLSNLSNEIINHTPPPPGRPAAVTPREFYFCNEIIQLMENVHLDLHLDDTWDDPDNAGWKDLFLKCSRSGTFRIVWDKSCSTYGKRFHYFCKRKLNLN